MKTIVDVANTTKQYANDLEEQKRKRNEHWARLKQARLVCPDPPNYPRWLEDTWGIRVDMKEGMITNAYTILDEKKYLMYLLKFG